MRNNLRRRASANASGIPLSLDGFRYRSLRFDSLLRRIVERLPAPLTMSYFRISENARGGSRTLMECELRWILSPVRLPVPPPSQERNWEQAILTCPQFRRSGGPEGS